MAGTVNALVIGSMSAMTAAKRRQHVMTRPDVRFGWYQALFRALVRGWAHNLMVGTTETKGPKGPLSPHTADTEHAKLLRGIGRIDLVTRPATTEVRYFMAFKVLDQLRLLSVLRHLCLAIPEVARLDIFIDPPHFPCSYAKDLKVHVQCCLECSSDPRSSQRKHVLAGGATCFRLDKCT